MSLDVELPAPSIPPSVPELTPPAMERLDPRYISMERKAGAARAAATAAFWLAVIAAFVFLIPITEYRVQIFGVWAILTAAHAAWHQYRPVLAYRHSSFRLDAQGIEIRRGIFFRSVITVPRSRVQHTDVSQGPFERRHGLGTLQIFTAGVMHAHVPLAGLAHERALEIRDALLPHDRASKADPSLSSG
jgi:membrane protein YdbS with pleckstrin-like domain